jgi:hypothetical protein
MKSYFYLLTEAEIAKSQGLREKKESMTKLWGIHRDIDHLRERVIEISKLKVKFEYVSSWCNSFKTFMDLPTSLPAVIFDRILNNSEQTCSEAAERNAQKIRRRFGHDTINRADSDDDDDGLE